MVRMLTYGISTSANDILGCSLTPANYCICKKTAIANHAQETPLQPFDQNRLVPVKVAGMTYGVAKKHHIVLQYEDGTTIPGYDLWLEDGAPIPDPAHPEKQGCTPDGWDPAKPATATGDGVYRQKYSTNTYVITFIGKDGQVLQQASYTYGQAVYAPDPQTPSGWTFDGWNNGYYDGIPATASVTYTGQYSQSGPDDDPPHDDDGHSGIDEVAYTMDNMGRIYNENKPLPSTSIARWAKNGQHWWSGPLDGDQYDVYGEDNGITWSGDDTGRRILNGHQEYDSDSCLYEYAKPDEDLLPDEMAPGTWRELLTRWSCPCYIDGEYVGDYVIDSTAYPWIKFVITRWNGSPSSYDGLTCPFYVHYFIENNESSESREGKVTVTTPGGTCHYNAGINTNGRGKPYVTEAHVYVYQLGKNE